MTGLRLAAHGGACNSKANENRCADAARAGFEHLAAGGTSIDAVVMAVVCMEDDPAFNAGTGSVFGMDGETIEMDASVMDSRGRLGAVTCLRRTKNPVRVAQAVSTTRHWLLAGEGATSFARVAGFPEYQAPAGANRDEHSQTLQGLRTDPARSADFEAAWNYPTTWAAAINACDTVGAVAVDSEGCFAVASSTGGCAPALLGRVGDTPIIGCGFYAGSVGAIGATGIGEHIVRHLLARTVYGWIEEGTGLQDALDRGIALFAHEVDVGLIGVTRAAAAFASNRAMPVHIIER